MQPLREGEEAAVAVGGPGGEAVEGLRHRLGVFDEVEHRAVGEEAPPLRVEPDEVEVVVEIATRLREDATKYARHREDRRPHVEPEAVGLEHGGLAAEPGVELQQRDLVAPRSQRAGRRQPAQPPADHADPLGHRDIPPNSTALAARRGLVTVAERGVHHSAGSPRSSSSRREVMRADS